MPLISVAVFKINFISVAYEQLENEVICNFIHSEVLESKKS